MTIKAGGKLRRSTQRRKRIARSDSKRDEVRFLSQCFALVSHSLCDASWTDPDEKSDEEEMDAVKNNNEQQFACTICRGLFRNAVETMYD